MRRARPVAPIRIFVPTDEENMPARDAINRQVYCSPQASRKPAIGSGVRNLAGFWVALLLTAAAGAQEPAALTIVSAQPSGEISALAQASEIRVRFSEAMVPIGAIPDE